MFSHGKRDTLDVVTPPKTQSIVASAVEAVASVAASVMEPEVPVTLGLQAALEKNRPRIGFISLGCPKNLVDSEVMMGMLDHAGAQLTNDPETADVLVVNTCSFIESAKQESVDTILEMAEFKKTGKARTLIVAGCLVERYRDEIQKNIPEVDAVVGTGELEKVLAAAGLSSVLPRARSNW